MASSSVQQGSDNGGLGVLAWAVFWKMRARERACVTRVSWTRTSGKGDAQGFENKHHQMNGMKALLAPMVKTGQRVTKLSQRQQIFLFHETSEKMEFIEDKTEHTGKRQPHKTKGTSTRALENVDALESNELDEELIELESGGLLPREMSALCNFCKRSHVPEEWCEHANSSRSTVAFAVGDPVMAKVYGTFWRHTPFSVSFLRANVRTNWRQKK
jgi:hypothetical protein